MTRLANLLVLLAVLLMPFGMAPAAASTEHHPAMAGMANDHCPDQGASHEAKGGIADCAMACSAALPAADGSPQARLLIVCTPVAAGPERALHGVQPHPATPPPKRS
jgi:hypothetical protein